MLIRQRKLRREQAKSDICCDGLSEERYNIAFHCNPALLSITSSVDGAFIDVNHAWLEAMGYRREEVIGHRPLEMAMIDAHELLKLRETVSIQGTFKNVQTRLRTKQGKEMICLVSGSMIRLNGKDCFFSSLVDITDQRRMEKELSRLDRLSLIGQMAGGIGHEIRNPLQTVRGFLQLFQRKEIYREDWPHFELMINELDQANAIISEVLSLARTRSSKLELKNLNLIVHKMAPLLHARAFSQNKHLEISLDYIPMVMVDEREIGRMLFNLAQNGLEAMEERKSLTIRTYTLASGQAVLEIRDQGKGISPEIAERLGTPFVTNKDGGTGLGLAVCFSIAERHNAKIEFETGAQGTTFYVLFPGPVSSGAVAVQ
ncbi:PAS domain S-box protein [Heliobacterium undosum]|uniref:histidine kinase n=1 Tax=Heliomicrobium undosum TaxID=121734 RepID=A0A845L063_9FIRM|nr:ATP-binding protein [Heliomicrobium undosum]MZP29862.1 PAS domain S-box protein [Heliomicrobium undosum]